MNFAKPSSFESSSIDSMSDDSVIESLKSTVPSSKFRWVVEVKASVVDGADVVVVCNLGNQRLKIL